MIFLCCCMKWCSSKLLDQVGSKGWEAMLTAWLSTPERLKKKNNKSVYEPPLLLYLYHDSLRSLIFFTAYNRAIMMLCLFLHQSLPRILKVSLSLCNVDFAEAMSYTNPDMGICHCSSSQQVRRTTGRLNTHNALLCSCV